VARARRRWIRQQHFLDTTALLFLDETATSTNMVRLWGRCPRDSSRAFCFAALSSGCRVENICAVRRETAEDDSILWMRIDAKRPNLDCASIAFGVGSGIAGRLVPGTDHRIQRDDLRLNVSNRLGCRALPAPIFSGSSNSSSRTEPPALSSIFRSAKPRGWSSPVLSPGGIKHMGAAAHPA
jgi:hypothetical protein